MIDNASVKILLVDDNPDFSDTLMMYLRKIGFQKITVAASFNKAKAILDSGSPDLALLDIDLGTEQNGVDLGIYIRQTCPDTRIVYFTNNFTESVFESVKPNAFLNKQLSELKVRQCVELALMQNQETPADLQTGHPLYYFAKEYIFVKVGPIFRKVALKDIEYIFFADRYANLQVGNNTYAVNMSMKQIGKNLPDGIFVQIHQTYIINMYKIGEVNFTDGQLEVNGKWLPIGGTFRKPFQDKLVLFY